jgi:hypothetical protein
MKIFHIERLCVGTYHDGFLFNSSLHPSQWREMKKEEVELALLKQGFDTRSLTYICCLRKYGEGNSLSLSHTHTHTYTEAFSLTAQEEKK